MTHNDSSIIHLLSTWLNPLVGLPLMANAECDTPAPHKIAWLDGQSITAMQLLQDVDYLISLLKNIPAERWVIWQECSYRFLVAFLALLVMGKKILLPQNLQQGTAATLAAEIDGIIAQTPVVEINSPCVAVVAATASSFNPIFLRHCLGTADWRNANVSLFTSGSTGEPKKITKAIYQLEYECALLEKTWASITADTVIYSTVSHQHIYGLLFRVLWPLLAGRCFVAQTFQYPEPLAAHIKQLNKPAVLIASPAHLSRMPELIALAPLTPWLKQVFSSGGPLAKITALDFKAALQFAPIEVLGSTETGGVAWRQQNGNDSDSTAPWQLLASVNARVNSEGALDIKSVHAGESWQTLGDNVEFVDEQHFYLKGRSDRIVKIEEKRLSLTELENHLLSTPWLSDVKAVVLQGVKTAGARTRVGIVAILNDAGQQQLDQLGRRFFNEALRQHLLQHIERVLLPRHWRYVAQWPVNAQGKVPQTALISLFNEDAN